MGVHDWRRVDAGAWHDFHLAWLAELRLVLNEHLLPRGFYALAEQKAVANGPDGSVYEPDILTLEIDTGDASGPAGNIAVLERPKTRQFQEAKFLDGLKSRRLAIRHLSGNRLVAVIELVSPGNKSSNRSFIELVDKSIDLLKSGVHLVMLDLFAPSKKRPAGLHEMIWEAVTAQTINPPDKPVNLTSYEVAGHDFRAYGEALDFGDPLPQMPLFLRENYHVLLPLDATYQQAWRGVPRHLKEMLT